ncbi:hypothetical protein ACJMK2_016557 [Sinanodonta woodiana]|uniref:Uncharacterized protein n=1 Tax=Sinanodonta woodiana TaxID=1069815 RepID=A0ABD3UXH8_SINWO
MAQIEVYLLMFVTICVGHVKSNTTCFDNGYKATFYCQYDCCGSYGYQHCCSDDSQGQTIGNMVGIILGNIVGFGIIIGIIACCCYHCRHSGTSGQVLQPHTNLAFLITTTNGTTVPMTQSTPIMYAPSYPTFPQMTGGQLTGNTAMNPYGAPQYTSNPSASPPPDYNIVANK